MQLIKINKKTNNKIEQAKAIASVYCMLSSIKLSDTDLTVLSYFMVYKINQTTKDLILRSKILKSVNSLKNSMSKLTNVGLIKKTIITKDSNTMREYVPNDNLNVSFDSVIGLLIKVDNK